MKCAIIACVVIFTPILAAALFLGRHIRSDVVKWDGTLEEVQKIIDEHEREPAYRPTYSK